MSVSRNNESFQIWRAHRTALAGRAYPPVLAPVFALVFALMLTLGCAGTIPGFSAIAPTANPSEQVTTLASELEGARSSQLDVLAPTWFNRAEESLEEAKSDLENGDSVTSILNNVAEGRAAIEQARTFGEVARQTLPDVIKAREDARSAGAAEMSAYKKVEARFLELTAGIESDSLSWARKTAPAVEKEFRSVELGSIKRNTVYRIEDLISKAKEAGANKFAPDLLRDVEDRYKSLDRFISQNRYASDAMGEKADEVLFYANRLIYVTEEAKRIDKIDPTTLALASEADLLTLSQKLELPDLRNQSQASQRRQIENAIDQLLTARHDLRRDVDRLQAETDKARGRIDALKDTAEAERAQLAKLEQERRFNQRFVEVSSRFSAGEAQVYKKGSQLVIRVRSLNFPVGSAVVLPEGYPVLAKVQQAIKSFDGARVVVEGHTDSTGSAEVNDRLSQQRADAVLAYLVNNDTVDRSRVKAVGKGFSEPLASDRTAAGRAQNRRIDVVIDASGESRPPSSGAGPAD